MMGKEEPKKEEAETKKKTDDKVQESKQHEEPVEAPKIFVRESGSGARQLV